MFGFLQFRRRSIGIIDQSNQMEKITIIGAGNSGKALAGVLALKGFSICLYNRSFKKIEYLEKGLLRLTGLYEDQITLDKVTTNLKEAVDFSKLIIVVTTNNAYGDLAGKIAKYLTRQHAIVLFSSSLCGSLEFLYSVKLAGSLIDFSVYEINNYIFLSREVSPGKILITGEKKKMLIAKPRDVKENKKNLENLLINFPAIKRAKNIFETGLSSMNPVIHCAILATNIDKVVKKRKWLFYKDGLTNDGLSLMEKIDKDRLSLAKYFNFKLPNILNYLKEIYPVSGTKTLKEHFDALTRKIYFSALGPTNITHRMFTEDIPYGLVLWSDLGKIIKVKTPNIDEVIDFFETKLNTNYRSGRNLKSFLPFLERELSN